jgi:hypothetical protein
VDHREADGRYTCHAPCGAWNPGKHVSRGPRRRDLGAEGIKGACEHMTFEPNEGIFKAAVNRQPTLPDDEGWLDSGGRRHQPIGQVLRRPEVLRSALTLVIAGAGLAVWFVIQVAQQTGTSGGSAKAEQVPDFGFEPALAFDTAHQDAVLFGSKGETWLWSQNRWKLAHPRNSPPARYSAAAAWDPRGEVVYLFGGYANRSGETLRDTWTWNGSTWTRMGDPMQAPPGGLARMVYDVEHDEMVLAVGNDPNGNGTQTWSWNGAGWHQKASSESFKVPLAAAFDRQTQAVVLIAQSPDGLRSDTWSWNGTAWHDLKPKHQPGASAQVLLVRASGSENLLLLQEVGDQTGVAPQTETWVWNGRDWLQLRTGSEPSNIAGAAFIEKGTGQEVLVFGTVADGRSTSSLPVVWKWIGNNWARVGEATR